MTNHPNVLPFVGLTRSKVLHGRVALVSPWMKNGNVLTYARRHNDISRVNLVSAISTTKGLLYLHAIDIIHGDIKCANIMVDDEGKAQLADFGLSTVDSVRLTANSPTSYSAGNPRWLAPELMFPEMFGGDGESTRESDAYAFGMTALELFTEQVPFCDFVTASLPFEIAVNGLTPSWPGPQAEARGLTTDVWVMMRNCWRRDPMSRSEALRKDLTQFATSVVEIIRPNSRDASAGYLKALVRKARRKTSKEGWFRNVWDVEVEDYGSVSARVIDVSALDSIRTYKLWNKLHWCKTLQHPNIASLIGISDALPSIKIAMVFNI
ncbi:kinase-like protein, partial [Schizopora paradoxa]